MRTSVLVSLAAGTALSMSAFAQVDPGTNGEMRSVMPIQRDRATRLLKVAGPENFGNPALCRTMHNRNDGLNLVYDNAGWDGTSYFGTLDYWFWFGFLNAPHYADDVSLVPGKASKFYAGPGGLGQLLTGMDIMIDCQDGFSSGARNFDMKVEFWNTVDDTTVAPANIYLAGSSMGSFVANLTLDALYTYLIAIDLTVAFPASGGLDTTDNGFHIDIAFYDTGTAIYMPVGDMAAVNFNCTSTWSTAGQSPTISNGFGAFWFFFDSNLDGVCANTERFRVGGVGGYFKAPNFAMNLYGDARCPADYDDNGFVEPVDYNAFINAYELGACP